VQKLVGELSGGERALLLMGTLALEDSNLLLLDAPSNHLDIPPPEVLATLFHNVLLRIVSATDVLPLPPMLFAKLKIPPPRADAPDAVLMLTVE
jgi:hypothetical protein